MYKAILKKYWGYEDFRGIQREIIESIAAGNDTLGLMPTGGGKSITFQVPALAMDGVCIVVTPLISLMKDQVDRLRRMNIIAYTVYSGMTHNEIVKVFDNCIFGKVKFLYISPERLATPFFLTKLRHMKVSFIAIDEAHCISQWGYDFRPSYLNISKLREHLPGKAVLALTATATPMVVKDIMYRLSFKEERVFKMSFMRKNLTYVVRNTEDKKAETLHILQRMKGTAIVYCSSRRGTSEIARYLKANGISADFYHAGLDFAVKNKRQNDWQGNTTRVIVATNAFGMGIDKPDVRLVIHYDCPNSLEAYFQEAGRAGRDGKHSYAVLLYNNGDTKRLRQRVAASFPSKELIADIYEHLAYDLEIGVGMGRGIVHLFDPEAFAVKHHYFPAHVNSAMHLLDRAGYIRYEYEPDDMTRVKFLMTNNELYQLNDLPCQEDDLITLLLRHYSGLFSEYIYINVDYIADLMKVQKEMVIMWLKDLYHRRVLRYIPPRKVPLLTYLVDRVDGIDIRLSPAVYDDRREQLRNKIESVVEYAENDSVCRSRQLLKYFGEETTEGDDCGGCDVCLNIKKGLVSKAAAPLRQQILDILADGKAHKPREMQAAGHSTEAIRQVIDALIAEGIIGVVDGEIILLKSNS